MKKRGILLAIFLISLVLAILKVGTGEDAVGGCCAYDLGCYQALYEDQTINEEVCTDEGGYYHLGETCYPRPPLLTFPECVIVCCCDLETGEPYTEVPKPICREFTGTDGHPILEGMIDYEEITSYCEKKCPEDVPEIPECKFTYCEEINPGDLEPCWCGENSRVEDPKFCCRGNTYNSEFDCRDGTACEEETYSINGTVYGKVNGDVELLEYAIVDPGFGTPAITDEYGFYELFLPPGIYTIIAKKTGYTPEVETIEVPDPYPTHIDPLSFVLTGVAGSCGDGTINPPAEECDIGNPREGIPEIPCSRLCPLDIPGEEDYPVYDSEVRGHETCRGCECEPCVSIPIVAECGNNIREHPEKCDSWNSPSDGINDIYCECPADKDINDKLLIDYPPYEGQEGSGTCIEDCTCNTGTGHGEPCEPNEYPRSCTLDFGGYWCNYAVDLLDCDDAGTYSGPFSEHPEEHLNDKCCVNDCITIYPLCDSNCLKNTGLCKCGEKNIGLGQERFCCATDENKDFVYDTQGDCYARSSCSPICEPEVEITFEKYPDGCFCTEEDAKDEGNLRIPHPNVPAGYCCADGTHQSILNDGCSFLNSGCFREVSGTIKEMYSNIPIEEATVEIKEVDGKYYDQTESVENGKYELCVGKGFTYNLSALKPGTYKRNSVKVEDITQDVIDQDLELEQTERYMIYGTVKDNTELELVGAKVEILPTLFFLGDETETGDGGNYKITGLIGTYVYTLEASMEGYETEPGRAFIESDNVPINFVLEPIICDNTKPENLIPTLTVEGVFCDTTITLTWENICPVESFVIIRNDFVIGEVGNGIDSFTDKASTQTKYCYQVGAKYLEGISPDRHDSVLILTEHCIGPYDSECITKEDDVCYGKSCVYDINRIEPDKIQACIKEGSDINQLDNITECEITEACVSTGPLTAECVEQLVCELCNPPLGIFAYTGGDYQTLTYEGTSYECNDAKVCYMDVTTTTVDKFYNCSPVNSCYDYGSREACEEDTTTEYNNRCLTRNCKWELDPRYNEISIGVCRELSLDELCPNDNDCDTMNNTYDPADYTETNTPILKPGETETQNFLTALYDGDVPIIARDDDNESNGVYYGNTGDDGVNKWLNVKLANVITNHLILWVYGKATLCNSSASSSYHIKVNDNYQITPFNWCDVFGLGEDPTTGPSSADSGYAWVGFLIPTSWIRDGENKFNFWDSETWHNSNWYIGFDTDSYKGMSAHCSDCGEGSDPPKGTFNQGETPGEVMIFLTDSIILHTQKLIDSDDDNDYIPDYMDPDDRTGTDSLQICDRCKEDEDNKIFKKCDKTRCSLYGECYFDGEECVNKGEMDCWRYTSERDCTRTFDVGVDVTWGIETIELGQTKTYYKINGTNILNPSHDILKLGVCRWGIPSTGGGVEPSCFKDADNKDSTVDVEDEGPVGYAEYAGTMVKYLRADCWKSDEESDEDDAKCRKNIAPPLTILHLSDVYNATPIISINIIKDAYNPDEGITTYIAEDSYPNIKVEDNNNILNVNNLLPLSTGSHTFLYFSEDDAHNLEPVKSFAINIDATDPNIIIEYDVTDVFEIEETRFTNLNITVNIANEEIVICSESLLKEIEEPPGSFKYIEIMQDYSFTDEWKRPPRWVTIYDALPDGHYLFKVSCYDVVDNYDYEEEYITLDTDGVYGLDPAFGTIDEERINLTLKTIGEASCEYFMDGIDGVPSDFESSPIELSGDYLHYLSLEERFLTGFKHIVPVKCIVMGKPIDDKYTFTVDIDPPTTTAYESTLGTEYDFTESKDKDQKIRLKCRDQVIYAEPGIKEKPGEFGCGQIYYGISHEDDCVPQPRTECSFTTDLIEKDEYRNGAYICYYCEDKGGNKPLEGFWHYKFIKLDGIKPNFTVSIDYPSYEENGLPGVLKDEEYTITVTSSEPLRSISNLRFSCVKGNYEEVTLVPLGGSDTIYKYTGVLLTSGDSCCDFEGIGFEGEVNFSIAGEDQNKNTGTEITSGKEFYIDAKPPGEPIITSPIIIPPEEEIYVGGAERNYEILGNESENLPGVDIFMMLTDNTLPPSSFESSKWNKTPFSPSFPNGTFIVTLDLFDGYNYIYGFEQDNHLLVSESPTEAIRTIVLDPDPPNITPLGPYKWYGLITPISEWNLSADIEDKITYVNASSINLIIDNEDGTTECGCGSCTIDHGEMECDPDENVKEINIKHIPKDNNFSEGTHDVIIKAEDRVANEGTSTWTFEVDPNVPHYPILEGAVPFKQTYFTDYYTMETEPDITFSFEADENNYIKITWLKMYDSSEEPLTGTPISGVTYSLIEDPRFDGEITKYSLDLPEDLELSDGRYAIYFNATKFDGTEESQKIMMDINLFIDTTPPLINITMLTPTMDTTPSYLLTVDDPCICSIETGDQSLTYVGDIGKSWNGELTQHEVKYIEIPAAQKPKYSFVENKNFMDGSYTATINCVNIVDNSNFTEKEFEIIHPKQDKVFYEDGEFIDILLKLEEENLKSYITADFSDIDSGDGVLEIIPNKTDYHIKYTISTANTIEDGPHNIKIRVAEPVNLSTSIIAHLKNDIFTAEVDGRLALRCKLGAGYFFNEYLCPIEYDVFNLNMWYDDKYEKDCDSNPAQALFEPDCVSQNYYIRDYWGIRSAINYSDDCYNQFCYFEMDNGVNVYFPKYVPSDGNFTVRFERLNTGANKGIFQVNAIKENEGITIDYAKSIGRNCEIKVRTEEGSQFEDCQAIDQHIIVDAIFFLVNQPEGSYPNIGLFSEYGTQSLGSLVEFKVDNTLGTYAYEESAYTDANGNHLWCNDGVDNDLDAPAERWPNGIGSYDWTQDKVDCRDPDCWSKETGNGTCAETEVGYCADGFDNDADDPEDYKPPFNKLSYSLNQRFYDCYDDDCFQNRVECDEIETVCNDNINNDFDYGLFGNDTISVSFQEKTLVHDNYDELTDCLDINCKDETGNAARATCEFGVEGAEANYPNNCKDNFDNDADGKTDCYDDSECWRKGGPSENINDYPCPATESNNISWCSDGIDNDFDDGINSVATPGMNMSDCKDYDCGPILGSQSPCPKTEKICNDGFDNDLDAYTWDGSKWEPNMGYIGETLTLMNKDCTDPDCDNLAGNDAGDLCQFGEETGIINCRDGFDNDGDGLTDGEEESCKTGDCYPYPVREGITLDSCADDIDQDGNELFDCEDDDCDGKICKIREGVYGVCINYNCIIDIPENCTDAIDNNFNGLTDCKEPVCYTEPHCRTYSLVGTTLKSLGLGYSYDDISLTSLGGVGAATIQYSKFVHRNDNFKVQFIAGASSQAPKQFSFDIGYSVAGSNTLAGITTNLATTTTDIGYVDVTNQGEVDGRVVKGIGYQIKPYLEKGNKIENPLNVYVWSKADKAPGSKQFTIYSQFADYRQPPIVKTLHGTMYISETQPPVYDGMYVKTHMGNAVISVLASDSGTGIYYCSMQIKKGNVVLYSSDNDEDCIWEKDGLSAGTYTAEVTQIVDGAGNIYNTVHSKSFTTGPIVQEGEVIYKRLVTGKYFSIDDKKIDIKVNFSIIELAGYAFLETDKCTVNLYDYEHNEEPIRTFEISSNPFSDFYKTTCKGEIDLTGLDNSSYTFEVIVKDQSGEIGVSKAQQFFLCPHNGIRCLDDCEINLPRAEIEITYPLKEPVLVTPEPEIDVNGTATPTTTVSIYVNTETEFQYQGVVGSLGKFNTKALMLDIGKNTIIAEAQSENFLSNFDTVDVEFNGTKVNIKIEIYGLPDKVINITTIFEVIDSPLTVNLSATKIILQKVEGTARTDIGLTENQPIGNDTIISEPTQTLEEGTYGIKVIPMMSDGTLGSGKLHWFVICPSGSSRVVLTKSVARTRFPNLVLEGYATQVPTSITLSVERGPFSLPYPTEIFVNPDGTFSANVTDILVDGFNDYYLETNLEGIKCQDVTRHIYLDREFLGVIEAFIACEDILDCREGEVCDNGRCVPEETVSVPEPEIQEPNCTDSDGGKNYYTKGTVRALGSDGVFREWNEECGTSQKLRESYCDPSSSQNVNWIDVYCRNGCQDYACVGEEEPVCASQNLLEEGEGEKIFVVGGRDYYVTVEYIGGSPVKAAFVVNGEEFKLKEEDSYELADGAILMVTKFNIGESVKDTLEFCINGVAGEIKS